jgi:hypothetical protein
VHGIAAVPISLRLVTQAGLLENLHSLDTMIVEKIARKGRHTITRRERERERERDSLTFSHTLTPMTNVLGGWKLAQTGMGALERNIGVGLDFASAKLSLMKGWKF